MAIFAPKFATAMLNNTRPNNGIMRFSMRIMSLLLGFGLAGSVLASSGGGENPDPGEFIIHHIADAHDIHLWGEGPSAVHIPLPVISYSPEYGWSMFSSAHLLHHGEDHVDLSDHGMEGAHAAHGSHGGGGQYHCHTTDLTYTLDGNGALHAHNSAGDHVKAYDLSISKSVLGMFIVIFMMMLIFPRVGSAYKKRKGQAPKGLQNALEPLILFIRDEVAIPSIGAKKADRYLPFLLTTFFLPKGLQNALEPLILFIRDEVAIPSIGAKKADRYLPFLLTTFFFIFLCNLLGLVPFIGAFNVTGTVGVTLILATFVFIITTVSGNRHYWGHIFWPPGVPLPIKLILVPVEVVGILLKPAVLMIRLTANIGAGHIIILALTFLVFIISDYGANTAAGIGTGIFSVAFMIFMYFIELLVAFLQAYVFTLLAALYFGDATQEAHH